MGFSLQFCGIHICIGRGREGKLNKKGEKWRLCASCAKTAENLPTSVVMKDMGYERVRPAIYERPEDKPRKPYQGLDYERMK